MDRDAYTAIQVIMMPKDANPVPTLVMHDGIPIASYRSIFGGVILSYIDQAGAIGARREVVLAGGPLPHVVTVAVNRVEFKQPVLVGDVVCFLTRRVRLGRTSITMHIAVEAERAGQVLHVTDAEVVYVGIDPTTPERRPVPLLPKAQGATG
ncbi:MAG: acyl-CoA thioesterase [Gemmataceae bacterium]|nr:acyl-CoA thioesterase [Gemmataceae bacterium]